MRHKTNAKGQLRPMTERMSAAQLAKREKRVEDRGMFRTQISREHAITRGIAVSVLQVMRRGFFGRLKWVLFGR